MIITDITLTHAENNCGILEFIRTHFGLKLDNSTVKNTHNSREPEFIFQLHITAYKPLQLQFQGI